MGAAWPVRRAPVEYLRHLASELGLNGRVEVRSDSINDGDLRTLLAAADAFVFPSRRQSYGLAPLEALAARTPVVLSAGAGVSEVIGGRPGVHVVPPEDPDAIAEALRAIRRRGHDPRLNETREWISHTLTPSSYASEMVRVFENVTGNPRA